MVFRCAGGEPSLSNSIFFFLFASCFSSHVLIKNVREDEKVDCKIVQTSASNFRDKRRHQSTGNLTMLMTDQLLKSHVEQKCQAVSSYNFYNV